MWKDKYRDKVVSAEEAVKSIRSGDHVVVSVREQPRKLCLALWGRRQELRNVTVVADWNEDLPWFQPGHEESFRIMTGFVLPPTRRGVQERRLEFVPHLVGIENGYRQADGQRKGVFAYADVCMVKLTPPDKNGYCSYGWALYYAPVAVRTAKIVLAEVDPTLPWTCGEYVHVSQLRFMVDSEPAKTGPSETDVEKASLSSESLETADWEKAAVVGSSISALIRDGDTLEIGVGLPSQATLHFLDTKNDLGIDSEIIYPEMIELLRRGVFTNKRKTYCPNKTTSTGLVLPGGRRVQSILDYIDHNPAFEFHDFSWVANVPRIAMNDNMVCVNTGIAIDLSGQVVCDHIGDMPYGGVGGQLEYTAGGHYSRGGRTVLAMLSTAKDGTLSRIVPHFPPGTPVTIPMYYTDYVVTEFGCVNLEGKSTRERAEALISIAHPDFRAELGKAARCRFYPND